MKDTLEKIQTIVKPNNLPVHKNPSELFRQCLFSFLCHFERKYLNKMLLLNSRNAFNFFFLKTFSLNEMNNNGLDLALFQAPKVLFIYSRWEAGAAPGADGWKRGSTMPVHTDMHRPE